MKREWRKRRDLINPLEWTRPLSVMTKNSTPNNLRDGSFRIVLAERTRRFYVYFVFSFFVTNPVTLYTHRWEASFLFRNEMAGYHSLVSSEVLQPGKLGKDPWWDAGIIIVLAVGYQLVCLVPLLLVATLPHNYWLKLDDLNAKPSLFGQCWDCKKGTFISAIPCLLYFHCCNTLMVKLQAR